MLVKKTKKRDNLAAPLKLLSGKGLEAKCVSAKIEKKPKAGPPSHLEMERG